MDQVFSFVGWAFLPSYATSFLQSIYYKITVPVGRAPPQPGTPLYIKHHRRIRTLVLTLYLIYTLLQSLYDIKLAGDFFTILSVNTHTSDREIKSRFRRLAAKYHPDKLRNSDNDANSLPRTAQDMHFLLLKTAQDTLLSPPLRYAYNRFGPSITHIQSPTMPSIQTYVLAGLRYQVVPSYLANIASLIAMNYLFLPKWGSYWRYLALSSIVVVEMYFFTHSDIELATLLPPYIPVSQAYHILQTRTKLAYILPPHLLPFQILTILRKLSISLNIFISQLAPPSAQPNNANLDSSSSTIPILARINQNLSHLHQIAKRTDEESTSLLHLQMTPFKGNPDLVASLQEGMREGMITVSLRQNPEVKEAIELVSRRKKEHEGRMRGVQLEASKPERNSVGDN